MSGLRPDLRAEPTRAGALSFRRPAEFLVALILGILLVRTFAAEAYIVPTGSMAPTLLGLHRDYTCPNCRIRFALGIDTDGRAGRPVCPNCGRTDWDGAAAVEGQGDRLLVQKFLFDLRPPRRWETAVFQNPVDPAEAYVKRVVGLPGESVLIREGDVYIDGRIARKDLDELRALRVPIYDHEFPPADTARYPRFIGRLGGARVSNSSGWQSAGSRFGRSVRSDAGDRIDWLEYRHWQPDQGEYGPIRDFLAYNGADVTGVHRVRDLLLEARVAVGPGVRGLVVRLDSGPDRFQVSIPVDRVGRLSVRRNGREEPVRPRGRFGLASSTSDRPRFVHLEAAVCDRRLQIALDGRLLFEPFDYDDPLDRLPPSASPIGLGVLGGGWAIVTGLKVHRDVYYTDALATAARPPFAVGEPYRLGANEFFVLGDNSPVSNDSRFWPDSPVVRRELFIGKPFLVHLPSQAVPLQVFGRELYWIPDPREIRYIR